VAQAERDSFEHRPRHVPAIVFDRQPDEGPAGQGVRMGAALAREVGEEEQAIGAGRHVGRRRDERAEILARRERVAEPAQAASCRQHHGHQVPSTGRSVAERVDLAGRVA
jgi:hypothetical protein